MSELQVDWGLEGRAIVIMGAGGGGIGTAIARALGRAGATIVAADIDPKSRGHEMWSASVKGVRSCTGEQLCERTPHLNFRIYWDADLEDELLDRQRLDKWIDYKGDKGHSRLITLPGRVCNGSKSTPNFSGDILGDWREEVILHGDDCLYLTTTIIPTPHRLYTLAHDPVYRLAMSWQNAGYNQPPHLGFWLGAGIDAVPQPDITLVPVRNRQAAAAGIVSHPTESR